MNTRDVTGVVLAGGQSRRMGVDKASLVVGGKPLIAYAIERLQQALPEVVVVAKESTGLELEGVRVIADVVCDKTGALVGIYSALKAVSTPYAFVVACDMPYIRPELVRWMVDTCQGCDALVPRVGSNIEPLFALYSTRCLPAVEKRLTANDFRVRGFFDDVNTVYAEESFLRARDPALLSFININTKEDLLNMKRLLGDSGMEEAHRSAYRVVRVTKVVSAGTDLEAASDTDDMVIVETEVELFLDDKPLLKLQSSPHCLDSLAVGHLLSAGFIRPWQPVTARVEDGSLPRVYVQVVEGAEDSWPRREPSLSSRDLRVRACQITDAVEELLRKSPLFELTGAAHAAGLCSTCGIVYWSEDVSRHNAVDRVLGQCLLNRDSFADKYLVTTGRVNWEMVQKAAACGIGLVASKAPPTDKGVLLAEKLGVTVVGFVRNRRLNVYTHPERMVPT